MHPKIYQISIFLGHRFLRICTFESQKELKFFLRQNGVSFSNDSLCADNVTLTANGLTYEISDATGLGDIYIENQLMYKALPTYAKEHNLTYKQAAKMEYSGKLVSIRREGRIYIKEDNQ